METQQQNAVFTGPALEDYFEFALFDSKKVRDTKVIMTTASLAEFLTECPWFEEKSRKYMFRHDPKKPLVIMSAMKDEGTINANAQS